MKKISLLLLALAFFLPEGKAQNEIDALRYSQLSFGGTARFSSMGGAFGALGGDISTLSYNPAGIGIYRKSEITFTPSIFSQTTNSTYNGSSSSDQKLNFNFGNIGGIFNYQRPQADNNRPSGWISGAFGIGYNRTNNFHNRIDMVGDNKENSLIDVFTASSQGSSPENLNAFSDKMAYYAWLTDYDTTTGSYSNFATPNAGIQQRKSIETRGSMHETVLSFGGNYNNRLYLGATIGFTGLKYIEESYYEEADIEDSIPDFNMFQYSQDLTAKGSGMNFKFGFIYRVTDFFRLGAAVHSPTYFSVSENYSSELNSKFDSGISYDESSPTGIFDYRVITPMRAIGSMAFIIKKKGLISADYEFIDYAEASLRSTPNVFSDENQTIRDKYTATGNIRVGAEWRLDPITLRGGYAHYGDPYSTYTNNDGSRNAYTVGLGIREEDYFLDFAYVLTRTKEKYYFYDPSLVNAASNKMQSSSFMITFGIRY